MGKGMGNSIMKSTYIVTIEVKATGKGKKPIVKTLGGDTIFCWLDEGMTAKWKIVKKVFKQGGSKYE